MKKQKDEPSSNLQKKKKKSCLLNSEGIKESILDTKNTGYVMQRILFF